MSASAAKRKPATRPKPNATDPQDWPPPFVPRRGLLFALLCVFALWIAVLLWMYFTTMPETQPAPADAPALAVMSSERVI